MNMEEAIIRLKTLASQMSLEPDAEHFKLTSSPELSENCPDTVFTHPAILPGGQKIRLLKTLLSSECERDCNYCPFRARRDIHRTALQPEEFARLFMMLAKKGIVEGVFLSSGVTGGGVHSQDKLLDTAEILRRKLFFHGYIHLKVMPGSEKEQVEHAMLLADRVSINLEAPNDARLLQLAPHKLFLNELLQPLKWIEEIRKTKPARSAWNGHWPSSVTQFVVGGVEESDLELLNTTDYLFYHLNLKRIYYSKFTPIPNTPLENQPPTPVIREHRLYQASFLLRDYGFGIEDLPFESDGSLPLHTDPKQAWAQKNLSENPLEINMAEYHQLIRVPGIGPKSVEVILRLRRQQKIRDPSILYKFGILVEKAAPFLLFDGRQSSYQQSLF